MIFIEIMQKFEKIIMISIELKKNYNSNYSKKFKNILKLINIFVLLFG